MYVGLQCWSCTVLYPPKDVAITYPDPGSSIVSENRGAHRRRYALHLQRNRVIHGENRPRQMNILQMRRRTSGPATEFSNRQTSRCENNRRRHSRLQSTANGYRRTVSKRTPDKSPTLTAAATCTPGVTAGTRNGESRPAREYRKWSRAAGAAL